MSSIIIEAATDDMNKDAFVDAVTDFIVEEELVGKFIAWLEKWRALHAE